MGAITLKREPAVNRDGYFDLLLVGPLVGLIASALLYVAGSLTSFSSTVPVTANGTQFASFNPSVIQYAIEAALSPMVASPPQGYVLLSPLADAATVGFALTFIGLMPLAAFDGGQLASLAWGRGVARASSYASVFFLIAIDIPYYWAVAVVILILAARPPAQQVLDEVSPLSSSRRWIYLGAVVLALLSLPFPQTFWTFGSG